MSPDPFAPRPRGGGDIRITNILADLGADRAQRAAVFTNGVGMKFALIPPGSFYMGEFEDDPAVRDNELPRHPVVVSTGYYMGVHPVTQAQFIQVTGANPAHFTIPNGGGPDHPVERVSYADAVAFCDRLAKLPEERAARRTYRLPTEAEWEYACRAGESQAFSFGKELRPHQANFGGGYRADGTPTPPAVGRTTPVGAYPPNNYGLYDLHGNVWEWCRDWYDERAYDTADLRDPGGPADGRFRVVRGGSWRSLVGGCRAAYRNALVPGNRDPYTGFRVVAVVA